MGGNFLMWMGQLFIHPSTPAWQIPSWAAHLAKPVLRLPRLGSFRALGFTCSVAVFLQRSSAIATRATPLALFHKMTFFHFFNCAALTFGPHAVYYKASPLSEYDTLGTCIKAAVVYLFTTLVKLVCLATFLQVSDHDAFDLPQELLKGLIGLLDVAGLYYAFTQVTHRSISQNHKFQAVALGWAFADAVLHKLAPLWVGARGLDFTWEYLLQGVDSNAKLVFTVSLTALGSLMWLRKSKPPVLVPFIYATAILVAVVPSIASYLRKGLAWEFSTVVSFELLVSLVTALVTWRLFVACQRPVNSS